MSTSPGSGQLYNLFYYAALALWAIIESVGAARQRRKVRREDATEANQDRGSYLLLIVSLLGGVIVAGVVSRRVPAGDLNWNQPVTVTLAGLLLLLGIALRGYAIRTLGRYFTNDLAASASQPVVQSGPYRLIRHPAYAGTLLSAIGAGLGMTNWISLLLVLAGFFIGHLYRMAIEEKALAKSIGQQYTEYMQRTKRLIPFVY